MSSTSDIQARYKAEAANRAVSFVESGMKLGLGSGSTATLALRGVAERLRAGELRDIIGFPSSRQIETEARQLGVPLMADDMPEVLDLTIDGADEVDPNLNVIKGAGGAMLREKIVAQASRRVMIIVDESKPSAQLGSRHSAPVEVLPFGWQSQARYLESIGGVARLRYASTGAPFITDSGNWVIDCDFGPIADPAGLDTMLNGRAGIVGHGLFVGLVTDVIVAGRDGVRHLRRSV